MAAPRPNEGMTMARPAAVVVEAVLALVIERPDYSFGLWKRFEERFDEVNPVTKSRIYQVVDQLVTQGLIEAMESESPAPRQPRIPYRATALGARVHREWLANAIQQDPRREELLRRLLATGARDARAMLKIVDVYEQACMATMARGDVPRRLPFADQDAALRDDLIAEESRLTTEASLKFVAYARRRLQPELDPGPS
jgi:DNA-binding PadR family transcriptional regulator